MKRLILLSASILLLLSSFACSSNSSDPKKEITEESRVFLPVINEFAGEITPTPRKIQSLTVPVPSPENAGEDPKQETKNAQPSTGPDSTKIPEDNSSGSRFKPFLKAPIPDDYNQEIELTYRYGSTQNGTRIPHDGVEFYNASGTPVLAAADGKVFFAGSDDQSSFGQFKDFYGNLVIIQHNINEFNYPVYTLYAHLSSVEVESGDVVKQGEKIGEVGASGSAIGSHLHFEVRIRQPDLQNRVNPELYLAQTHKPAEIKSGILVGKILDHQEKFIPENQLVIQLIENGQINPDKVYYTESYASNVPSDPQWEENFVVSNLPAGRYRITTFIENQFVEQYVDINNDFVTDITLSANN